MAAEAERNEKRGEKEPKMKNTTEKETQARGEEAAALVELAGGIVLMVLFVLIMFFGFLI